MQVESLGRESSRGAEAQLPFRFFLPSASRRERALYSPYLYSPPSQVDRISTATPWEMLRSSAASTSRLKLPTSAAPSLSQCGTSHRPRTAPVSCSSSSPSCSTRNFVSSATHLQQQQQQQQRSSVHASEVEHFTRLSSTWWDPNAELGLLHKMNKGRIAFLRDKVIEAQGWDRARDTKKRQEGTSAAARARERREERRKEREWCKGLRVLDVGCGGGLLSEVSQSHGGRRHPTYKADAEDLLCSVSGPTGCNSPWH